MRKIFIVFFLFSFSERCLSGSFMTYGGQGSQAGSAGQGGFFSPAAVLKKSTFAVGFEPQYYLDAYYEYGFMGHLRYGILPRVELNSMIGVYNAKLYTSFGGTYQMVYDRNGLPGLTFRVNYFFNDDEFFGCENGCGIDADAILGHSIGSASWYAGFNLIYRKWERDYYDINYNLFIVQKSEYEYNLIGGVHYLINYWAGLNAEIGINVNNKKTTYTSAGMTFYFGK